MNRTSYTRNLLRSWGMEHPIESIDEDVVPERQRDSVMEGSLSKCSKDFEVAESRAEQSLAEETATMGRSVCADKQGSKAQHPALRTRLRTRFLPPGPPPNRPLPPLPDGQRGSVAPAMFDRGCERVA